jgi:hypothetical protein
MGRLARAYTRRLFPEDSSSTEAPFRDEGKSTCDMQARRMWDWLSNSILARRYSVSRGQVKRSSSRVFKASSTVSIIWSKTYTLRRQAGAWGEMAAERLGSLASVFLRAAARFSIWVH